MKIKISTVFCAMVCILGWLNAVLCGWFLLGMLVHELGHLVVLRLCGVPVGGIRIGVCGAVIETGWMAYGKEIVCAAAGPAVNILIGASVLRAEPEFGLVNLALAAVNLLPFYPMDGGRMLRAVLLLCCSQEWAERIVHWATVGTCLVLMVLSCWATAALQAGVWPIFAALVLLWRAGGKEKQLLFSGAEDKMKGQEQ